MRSKVVYSLVTLVIVAIALVCGLRKSGPDKTGSPLDVNPGVPHLARPDLCGIKDFWVDLGDFPDRKTKSEITFSNCGLSPVVQRMDRFFGFEVTNDTNGAKIVSIIIFRPDGSKRGFTRALKPREKLEFHRGNFNLADDEYLMVYDDQSPEAGVAALFPNDQKGLRKVTRSPLIMVLLDEKTGIPQNSSSKESPHE